MARPKLAGALLGGGIVIATIVSLPLVRNYPVVRQFVNEPPLPAVRYTAGELLTGERAELSIPWTNYSPKKVTVLGGQTSCTCVGLAKASLSANPYEQITIPIVVRPRKPGSFHQRVVCFIDHPNQDPLTLDVVAMAVTPRKEN